MEDLKRQADELGIKIDGRWSDERIQQEIDKVLEAPADSDGGKPSRPVVKPTEQRIPVRINRDFWTVNPADPGNPVRNRKGTVIEVTVSDALEGIETGALSRVK